MNKIPRQIFEKIKDKILTSNKVILLYGARQVGKTTIISDILNQLDFRILKVTSDERKYVEILSSRDCNILGKLVSGYDLLFIDEAQRIPDIGINLKLLHENFPDLKIIATGSSSFDLANKVKEPLTGRAWTFTLYPIAVKELLGLHNPFEIESKLEDLLVYGSYPEVFDYANHDEKYDYLKALASSYLYKDVLELSTIKHPRKIHDLLRLLAFQIGSQVSIAELAASLEMGKDTVDSYISLLEKSFVLFRLPGFSRNLRKEVTKMDKIYFYDLGIRNTIIDNMNSLNYRDDHGKLWENFLIAERKKQINYQSINHRLFFWRTYTGSELDLVEEGGEGLGGYEFKFKKIKINPPKGWSSAYPEADYRCVTSKNFLDFINS